MNTYPLPGETVTRTLRGVEFGTRRPRDEPAPPEIAESFRVMQEAFGEMGSTHQQWHNDRGWAAWDNYRAAAHWYNTVHCALLCMLRRRPGRCYTCDGHRFWLYVEPDGCRRNTIRIEALQ